MGGPFPPRSFMCPVTGAFPLHARPVRCTPKWELPAHQPFPRCPQAWPSLSRLKVEQAGSSWTVSVPLHGLGDAGKAVGSLCNHLAGATLTTDPTPGCVGPGSPQSCDRAARALMGQAT